MMCQGRRDGARETPACRGQASALRRPKTVKSLSTEGRAPVSTVAAIGLIPRAGAWR